MSSDIINWRLFHWHLHVGMGYRFWFSIRRNPYHIGRGSKWFQAY